MAISDYSTLQTAVADWLARADLELNIPDFIQLAESRLTRDIKSPRMLMTDVGYISSYTIPFPVLFQPDEGSFCEIVRLTVSYGGRDLLLEPMVPATALDQTEGTAPRGYYILGSDIVTIGGSGAETYTLVVKNSLPKVSSGANLYTNWVIQKAPELYLYASLLEASPYLKADNRIGVWAEGYRVALQSLNEQEGRLAIGYGARVKPVHNAP